MSDYHVSVLLKEAIDGLNIKKGGKYIDATLGGGGHTSEILKKGAVVLGIDVDQDAIKYVESRIKNQESPLESRIKIVKGNFKDIDEIAKKNGFESVDGILFDLGVSMHQLKTENRGFSFLSDAGLDMRMDQDLGVKAADLLKILTKRELYEIFKDYGEEEKAWEIAVAIDKTRKNYPIETTAQLVGLVEKVKGRNPNINPATKIFQALRIAVNSEFENLKEALPKAAELLKNEGRLVVISFHSIEDRITKNIFTEFVNKGKGRIITNKPIMPTEREVEENKPSRSAKMRVFEKI